MFYLGILKGYHLILSGMKRGGFPATCEQRMLSTTQHWEEGEARLDWKGVIKCSDLTPGRQVLGRQHNPRLLFQMWPHLLLCGTVYSRTPSLCQSKWNTPFGGASNDRVQVWELGCWPQRKASQASRCTWMLPWEQAAGFRLIWPPASDSPPTEVKGWGEPTATTPRWPQEAPCEDQRLATGSTP